jgi:hypothetical protein
MAKRAKKEGQKTMRAGSRVLCVDDRFPTELLIYYNALPLKDRTYTVRGLGIGVDFKGEPGEVVVYLQELKNPNSSKPPHPERGFAQWRFREIQPPAEASKEAQELVEAEA